MSTEPETGCRLAPSVARLLVPLHARDMGLLPRCREPRAPAWWLRGGLGHLVRLEVGLLRVRVRVRVRVRAGVRVRVRVGETLSMVRAMVRDTGEIQVRYR